MSHSTYYRRFCIKNSSCKFFIIKAIKILYGSSASSHYQNIQIHLIKFFYGGNNTFCCRIALYKAWSQNYSDIRISSVTYILYIIYYGSGLSCCHTYTLYKPRYFFLISLIEHTHIFKLFLKLQIFFVQISLSCFLYLICIELIPALFFITGYSTCNDYLLPSFHIKRETSSLTGKHNRR